MPVGGEGKEGPWFEEGSDRRRGEGRAGDLGKRGGGLMTRKRRCTSVMKIRVWSVDYLIM